MFERPLLQDDIWANFLKFNHTYFTSRTWPMWLGVVAAVLVVAMFLLRNALKNKQLYQGVFAKDVFIFDYRKIGDMLGLFAVMASIVFIEVYIYTSENTLFENYDLMAINTTRTMRYGLVASFDFVRVIPLASWYLSTLYAITQNIMLIKAFVMLQIMLMSWALYAFFNYIPVVKRLFMIALFLLSPTFLQTSNIIFPERDVVILLMLGLICARKYCLTHKFWWAAAFVFLVNVSFYTKETCIVFYFGIMIISILYNVIKENIVFDSFLHPWKIIKSMPLEFLIGLSLFGYLFVFEIMQNKDNFYLDANNQPLIGQIVNYRMELILLMIAISMAISELFKNRNFETNPLFRSGLLFGSVCVVITVVFVLKLAPSTPHLADRSYYLLITHLFVLAYLFEHISGKWMLGGLSVVMAVYSIFMNMRYYNEAKGMYYREVAEFMEKHSTPQKPTAMFIMEDEYVTKTLRQWIIETWATSYRYYFNDRDFVIKSDAHYLDRNIRQKLRLYDSIPLIYFHIEPQALPIEGDWVVVNKNNKTKKANNIRKDYEGRLVYENALFEVYEPK